MAIPKLTACLCGNDELDLAPSAHREKAREQTHAHYQEVQRQPHARGAAARDFFRTELALQVLSVDHYDVSCTACGRWVHGESQEAAAVLWNKAIDKLQHLQACCQDNPERRVDYDGQVLCVCTSDQHDDMIHGRRYLPLEPFEHYDVKPSDAETKV